MDGEGRSEKLENSSHDKYALYGLRGMERGGPKNLRTAHMVSIITIWTSGNGEGRSEKLENSSHDKYAL